MVGSLVFAGAATLGNLLLIERSMAGNRRTLRDLREIVGASPDRLSAQGRRGGHSASSSDQHQIVPNTTADR